LLYEVRDDEEAPSLSKSSQWILPRLRWGSRCKRASGARAHPPISSSWSLCWFILLENERYLYVCRILQNILTTRRNFQRQERLFGQSSLRNHSLITAYLSASEIRLTHPLDHAYMVQTKNTLKHIYSLKTILPPKKQLIVMVHSNNLQKKHNPSKKTQRPAASQDGSELSSTRVESRR